MKLPAIPNPFQLFWWLKPALIAGGAALIIGSIGGLTIGMKLGDAKVDRIVNKTLIRNQVIREKADVISAEVGTKTAQAEAQVRTVTITNERLVPTYVPLKGSCDIAPSGFVSVLDAAAEGSALPVTPAEPADTPSGYGFDQVARVTAGNLGQCHEEAARLAGLQEWVTRNVKLFNEGK